MEWFADSGNLRLLLIEIEDEEEGWRKSLSTDVMAETRNNSPSRVKESVELYKEE